MRKLTLLHAHARSLFRNKSLSIGLRVHASFPPRTRSQIAKKDSVIKCIQVACRYKGKSHVTIWRCTRTTTNSRSVIFNQAMVWAVQFQKLPTSKISSLKTQRCSTKPSAMTLELMDLVKNVTTSNNRSCRRSTRTFKAILPSHQIKTLVPSSITSHFISNCLSRYARSSSLLAKDSPHINKGKDKTNTCSLTSNHLNSLNRPAIKNM